MLSQKDACSNPSKSDLMRHFLRYLDTWQDILGCSLKYTPIQTYTLKNSIENWDVNAKRCSFEPFAVEKMAWKIVTLPQKDAGSTSSDLKDGMDVEMLPQKDAHIVFQNDLMRRFFKYS